MNLPTAYIIGKVGDLSDDDYYDYVIKKFGFRGKSLTRMGFVPINPMQLVPRDATWDEAMSICIPVLMACDYISPLPDTWYSRGGLIEFNLARSLYKPIVLPKEENFIYTYEHNL